MTIEQKLERRLRRFMSGTSMFHHDKNSTSGATFYATETEIKELKEYILKLFNKEGD